MILAAYDTWAWSGRDLIVFVVACVVGVPAFVLLALVLEWPADGPSLREELRRWAPRARTALLIGGMLALAVLVIVFGVDASGLD